MKRWAPWLLVLLAATRARAEEQRAYHLLFEAEDACGTEAAFREELEARWPGARRATAREAIKFIQVRTRPKGDGAVGELHVTAAPGERPVTAAPGERPATAAPGERSTREIEAPNCDELVEGLALIAALVLAEASRAGDEAAAGEGSSPGDSPGAAQRDQNVAPPAPGPASARAAEGAGGGTSGPGGASAWARPTSWFAGVHGIAVVGVFPEPGYGAGASLALRWLSAPGEPELRLGARRTLRSGHRVSAAQADFSLTTARLSLCPLSGSPLPSASLGLCGDVEAGFIEASGSDIDLPQSERRAFVGVGGSAHARWMVLGRLGIELELGAVAPLRRDEYAFDDEAFHEVAAVTAAAALGLVVRLDP